MKVERACFDNGTFAFRWALRIMFSQTRKFPGPLATECLRSFSRNLLTATRLDDGNIELSLDLSRLVTIYTRCLEVLMTELYGDPSSIKTASQSAHSLPDYPGRWVMNRQCCCSHTKEDANLETRTFISFIIQFSSISIRMHRACTSVVGKRYCQLHRQPDNAHSFWLLRLRRLGHSWRHKCLTGLN